MSERVTRRLGTLILISAYGYVILGPALAMTHDSPPGAFSKIGSAVLLLYPNAVQVIAVVLRLMMGESGSSIPLPRSRSVSGTTVCMLAILAGLVLNEKLAQVTYTALANWARSYIPTAVGALLFFVLALFESRDYTSKRGR